MRKVTFNELIVNASKGWEDDVFMETHTGLVQINDKAWFSRGPDKNFTLNIFLEGENVRRTKIIKVAKWLGAPNNKRPLGNFYIDRKKGYWKELLDIKEIPPERFCNMKHLKSRYSEVVISAW